MGVLTLWLNYVATTWHFNAVLVPQSPHERTAALLNTLQLILRSQLFFSSKLPALLRQIVCTFREALKKLLSVHAIKAFRRRGGTAPLILNFGTVNVRLHSPATLPLVKNWIRGWAPHRVWVYWRREKISCPYWNSNPESSIPQSSHYTDSAIHFSKGIVK